MKHLVLSLACVTVLGGCVDLHSQRNLPASVPNLRERPRSRGESFGEHPAEDQLIVSAGPLVGGGGHVRSNGAEGVFTVGGEASVLYAYAPRGHIDGTLVSSSYGLGGTFGAAYVSSFGGSAALYAEAEGKLSNLIGLGLGWQYNPVDKVHGPQATVRFGPLFVRLGHQLDNGTFLTGGLLLKPQVSYSTSR